MGPSPAVAAIRLAVRQALQGHPIQIPVLVACSGGADSTALAAATVFECNRGGRGAGLVTVDHGLQDGSAEQAAQVSALGYELGFDPVHTVRVEVGSAGGPEGAARAERYGALEKVRGSALVLLGHTADDQAETVLLGLGRGSGPRSVAGMRPAAGGYLRPLLGLRRAQTEQACLDLGLPVWDDPHNIDPRFVRVRVRNEVLPLLDDVLAGGIVPALARTAALLADDLDALDALAAGVRERAVLATGELAVADLAGEHRAIQSRVLKAWAEAAGAGPLSAGHVTELVALVSAWRGQGPIRLPGGAGVVRSSGRLTLYPAE